MTLPATRPFPPPTQSVLLLASCLTIRLQDGERNVTVAAFSDAEGWVAAEEPLTFRLLNKIQGLHVTDFNIITPTVSLLV